MTTHRIAGVARTGAFSGAVCAALLCVGAAQAAGTLTYCSEYAPEGFDIAQYETVGTGEATIPIYDQLLGFVPGTTRLQPGLAQSWDVSADGLVYTFRLRPGVKWHKTAWFTPTRDLDADDVVWSLRRMNDKSHPGYAAAKNGWVYWAGMNMPALVKAIDKVDAMTVRVTLTKPEAPFLADMAMSSLGTIIPAEYAEQLAKAGKLDQLNTQPVGSGPFIFRSYQKDATVRYTANPAYWGGAPKVDHLVFAITVDPSVRVQRVKAGECMVAKLIPAGERDLAGDARVRVERSVPIRTAYVAPNAQRPYLSDPRFREALLLSIDKKNLIQAVYAGLAQPLATFLPASVWSHDASLPERRDVERAKALVKASGYDGRELWLYTVSGRADNKRGAEVLQADWAAVGVKVGVRLMELGELYKRTGAGEHDLTFLSWFGDNGDPDNFFTPNLSCAASVAGGNKAHWCSKPFDALIDEARRTTDLAVRTRLYTQAQRLLYDDVGTIPIATPVSLRAERSNVRGVIVLPFGHLDFRQASID